MSNTNSEGRAGIGLSVITLVIAGLILVSGCAFLGKNEKQIKIEVIQQTCLDFKPVLASDFFMDWLDADPYVINNLGEKVGLPITGGEYFKEVENNNQAYFEACPESEQ